MDKISCGKEYNYLTQTYIQQHRKMADEQARQLQEYHKRNQQFLQSQQSNNGESNTTINKKSNNGSGDEILHLNKQILELKLQVRQLTNEVETTRDAYQVSSDKSRAEIAMLQAQIEHQNSRHDAITSSLRERLVESEMARLKMQDQLVASIDSKMKDDEEMKTRWNQMCLRVGEETKWVDEQIDHWKQSTQDRRRRLHDAKLSGANGVDGGAVDGSEINDAIGGSGEVEIGKRTVHQRRSVQRRLWGKDDYYSSNDAKDDHDDDSEVERIFGK